MATNYEAGTVAVAGMADHVGHIVVSAAGPDLSWVQCRCGFLGSERPATHLGVLVSDRNIERADFSRHLRAVHRRAIGETQGRSIALDGPDLAAPIAELLSVSLAQAYLTNPLGRLSRLVRRVGRQTQRSVGDLHPRLWPIADAALTATLRAGVHPRLRPTADATQTSTLSAGVHVDGADLPAPLGLGPRRSIRRLAGGSRQRRRRDPGPRRTTAVPASPPRMGCPTGRRRGPRRPARHRSATIPRRRPGLAGRDRFHRRSGPHPHAGRHPARGHRDSRSRSRRRENPSHPQKQARSVVGARR